MLVLANGILQARVRVSLRHVQGDSLLQHRLLSARNRAALPSCSRLACCRGVGGFSTAAEAADGRPAAGALTKLLSRIGLASDPAAGTVRFRASCRCQQLPSSAELMQGYAIVHGSAICPPVATSM